MQRIRSAGTAAALLAFALISGAAAQQPMPPDPSAGNRPVKSPGNAEWAKDLADARAAAAAQKKLVYVEFDQESCGNCRRMQSLLYPAFDFEALLIGMVPVKVALNSPEAKPLVTLYGITEAPGILITTAEGRLVFLMQGFQTAPDFYGHVRKDLDSYRKFAKRIDEQDVAMLSADEAYATGRELFARHDAEAARPRLKRATVAPDPKPGVRESALEGLAAAELELGQADEARKTIDRLITTTKSPDQKERAELFRAQIPLAQNKPAEALALYRKFAADHPGSKYIERVRSFIERLESASPASK
jgi:tetratricopeptide (TPR) repeat protein